MRPRAVAPLLAWAFWALTVSHAADPASKSGFWKRVFSIRETETADRLFFNVTADIPLPGPLPGPGPELTDGAIEIPVAGGIATTGWTPESEPVIASKRHDPPAVPVTEFATDPENLFRARFLPDGKLLMQKRCLRCKKGWRKKWKLRMPGNATLPPLITENRVYFGAPDNRVYSLRKKNGHRIWDVDLGSRISRSLVLWIGSPTSASADGAAPDSTELILALPDNGSRLIALDARTGQEVARFELPADSGRIRAIPLPTPDGKIVVAREKYNPENASLTVLELSRASAVVPPATAGSGDAESGEGSRGDAANSDEAPPPTMRKKQ